MDEINDRNLAIDLKNGDNRALKILFEKYYVKIVNIAFRYTGNYEDASDITQTVFLRVIQNINKYDPQYKFFSWLYKITVNEAINFGKKNSKKDNIDRLFISDEKSPEEIFRDKELNILIQRALANLSPEQRILIILKHLNSLSYKEISEILDIKEKKVKSRLYSARQQLKNMSIIKNYIEK